MKVRELGLSVLVLCLVTTGASAKQLFTSAEIASFNATGHFPAPAATEPVVPTVLSSQPGQPGDLSPDDPTMNQPDYYGQSESETPDPDEVRAIQEWEALDREIKLRDYDKLAMKLRQQYDEAKRAANPYMGQQGVVIFPYGEAVPRVTCRPFRVTDLRLAPGEEILGIHAGDTTRWTFEPSESIARGQSVKHVIIKPSTAGISTNLVINTNRRTYNLDLTATDGDKYLPSVAFSYPDGSESGDLNKLFVSGGSSSFAGGEKSKALNTSNLFTRYTLKVAGNKKLDWLPLAVFDDGTKTYINMPGNISEAPALYICLDGKDTLVNYRVSDGRYYVVDRLFDKAYLKLGAKRVAIIRQVPLSATPER